jgi:hypothetical protein
MSYNFLRDAQSITNSYVCRYDTLDGYISDFGSNGNVDGWDVYYNTYMYGCWNGNLFGTAFDRAPYIGRNTNFLSVEAEHFYYIKIMMKLTNNNTNKVVGGLTTGMIRWVTTTDVAWDSNKELNFDIIADDQWHLYTINMGPSSRWIGYVNNLRVYPFTDGWSGDQFAIRFIKISSLDQFHCSNSSCSYYGSYEHECLGAGSRGYCEAGTARETYTLISGTNDQLIVNIDDYGDEVFNLGTHLNVSGRDMAKIIANKLSSLNIGGYAYVTVEHSFFYKLKIISGTVGTESGVLVKECSAAEELGFYSSGTDISTYSNGEAPATGFDYASSRLLSAYEINKLVDNNTTSFAYVHNPDQKSVEGGRNDFNQVGVGEDALDFHGNKTYVAISNRGKTTIDLSHPFNNNGKITTIYVYGTPYSNAKIKICRPHSDGSFTVIHSLDVPQEDPSKMYTELHVNFRIDCNIIVNKGDCIGVYDMDLYVGKNLGEYPDATYSIYNAEATGTFFVTEQYSYGVAGLAIYARGDRSQSNTILDIDLGNRVNIEELSVYGKEDKAYLDFNVMSCLDMEWDVDVFGETHTHLCFDALTGHGFTETHDNIPIGEECLNDMIITPDNGNAGDSLESDSGTHAYFYVTGDAEWLNNFECDGKHEFCYPFTSSDTINYKFDPVAFTVYFPYGYSAKIFKSIIYFKEKNNFRSFALSYYRGPYSFGGDADLDTFMLVPSYTSIRLDGIGYSSNSSMVGSYLYNNPTSARPVQSNISSYLSSLFADWTILEHNFDEIDCYGFRIYCNEHYSTKITEIELYSKVATDPSLSDNLIVSFSDYGDVWKSVSFSSSDDINKATAFIGGSPRYFRIEVDSATEFEINELEAVVGDQFVMDNCDDEVLLQESKIGVVSSSTPVSFENVYDKPFDLYVDIPRDIITSNTGLIFSSSLNSEDDLVIPDIGPSAILYKRENYQISNYNYQCATNCSCYGLKNLINEKNSYTNTYLDIWDSYETLSSGISLNYHNVGFGYRETIISFTAVSSKYWKLVHNLNNYLSIDSIVVYYEGTQVDIDNVYFYSNSDSSSQDYATYHENGLAIRGGIIKNDVTGEWVIPDPDNWNAYSTSDDLAEWEISGSHFEAVNFGGAGDYGNGGPTIEYEFDPITDFTIDLGFVIYRSSTFKMSKVRVYLLDESDNEILFLDMINVWTSRLNEEYTDLYSEGVQVWGTVDIQYVMYHDDDNVNLLHLKRSGSNLEFKINNVKYYNSTFSSTSVSKIKLCLWRNDEYSPANKAAFYFGSHETAGFSFSSSEPIDTIKLKHACNIPSGLGIYVSPNNGNNYIPIASSLKYTWNENDTSSDTNVVLSNGDLTAYVSYVYNGARSIFHKNSGKWYWEITLDATDAYDRIFLGIGTAFANLGYYPGSYGEGYSYFLRNGTIWPGDISYGDDCTAGDVVGTALDLDNGKIWWSKNGVWQNGGVPVSGTNPAFDSIEGDYYVLFSAYTDNQITANFGESSFTYSPPVGFIGFYTAPLVPSPEFDKLNGTYYTYFAIDLEKRHDLDIIRNYGTDEDKIFLSLSSNTDFSNSDVSDPSSVDWGNSTKDDVRWIRIPLLCGDSTLRALDYVGIYPDITTTYCLSGGYNCEWESLGNILTSYDVSKNVAYGAGVSGTSSYFSSYYPYKAVDGVYSEFSTEYSWGFSSSDTDPYLDLVFDDSYIINKIILHHGLAPDDDRYRFNDYKFYISPLEYWPGGSTYLTNFSCVSSGTFGHKMLFDGATSCVTITDTDNFNFEREDFTIDFRVIFNSVGSDAYIVDRESDDSSSAFAIYKNSSDKIVCKCRNYTGSYEVINMASNTTISGFLEYHIAFVRSGGNFYLYINGDYDNSTTYSGGIESNNNDVYLGKTYGNTHYFNGVLGEFRVYSGAVWSGTSSFSVPSSAYDFNSNTLFLMHFEGEGYQEVLDVSSNTELDVTHNFDKVVAKRARLRISDYEATNMTYIDPDTEQLELFNGCFLREIEVYSNVSEKYIDSEAWPVVSVDLNEQFRVKGHDLFNKDLSDTDTDWNNDEDYFKYSDSVFSDPKKVTFFDAGSEVTIYYSGDNSGDVQGAVEYIFDENVYINSGTYKVSCQMYGVSYLDEVSLRFEGNEIIDVFPSLVVAGDWQDVNDRVTINTSGYYTVKGYQHLSTTYSWGVRYPRLYRNTGLTKWLAVKRDTATEYSWDDDSDKYGKDYLDLIKVYGDERYSPTQYSWWWSSNISSLSEDYLKVVEEPRSLKIAYPTSSGSDEVSLIEGDNFGNDTFWSVKDFLVFWLYIDDINKLDTNFGDISFGSIYSNPAYYYSWYISNLNLSSGWNHVRLKFENNDITEPALESYYIYSYMDPYLDFSNPDRALSSFRLRYRGKGEPFNIYLTGLEIERNDFDDEVKFGNGLCLVGYDYLEIPVNGLTLEKGTIEFWLKTYYDSYGIDIFGNWNSRTLFTVTNNNNNIVGLAVKSGSWFEVVSGHVRQNLNAFYEQDPGLRLQNYVGINEVVHLALAWSNDGTDMDNDDTVRFYVNGELYYTSKAPWEVNDTKSAFIKFGGGNTRLASGYETFGGGIFNNIKVYDYCKDDFDINSNDLSKSQTYSANKFIEVSSNDIDFYSQGSDNLPIIFEAVPVGRSRTIYIRTNKDDRFKNSNKTANLIVDWLTTV